MLEQTLQTTTSFSLAPADDSANIYTSAIDQVIRSAPQTPQMDFTDLLSEDMRGHLQQLAQLRLHHRMFYIENTARLTQKARPLEQKTLTSVVPDSITNNWQRLARAGLTEKSYRSILRLAKKDAAWRGEGSLPMNSSSLATFLQFWALITQDQGEPEFVLMPNGNLQVEWYKNNRHFVELEFQPDTSIIFGIFDARTIIEGVSDLQTVIQLLLQRRSFKFTKKSLLQKVA
jgi:hypothetical protein